MENYKIEKMLKPMLGKAFINNNKEHRFVGFEITDTVIKINTDSSPVIILKEDAQDIHKLILLVDDKPVIVSKPMSGAGVSLGYDNGHRMATTIIGQHGVGLAEIIMANIAKVQDDASFIPQAESVNNQIKTLIDVAKTEVEMLKVAAYMTK